jgi:hypothetical protein
MTSLTAGCQILIPGALSNPRYASKRLERDPLSLVASPFGHCVKPLGAKL